MDQLQKKYNFRLTTSDEFKFCGRIIKQNEKGHLRHLSSSSRQGEECLHLPPEEEAERRDGPPMRRSANYARWLEAGAGTAGTCRPDLAFGVNQLQAVQQRARVEDLVTANRLLAYALATKERGVFYSSDCLRD